MTEKKEFSQVKILMLGEGGVGKSSLLFQYVDGKFSENIQATLGVEFKQKVETIDNKKVTIQVWDTAGQEKFKTITPIYYKRVDGVCLVFSVVDRPSFQQVQSWIHNLNENSTSEKSLCKVLIGNKCDMPNRTISEEEGIALGQQLGLKYYECSAKTGKNVNEVFTQLVQQVVTTQQPYQPQGPSIRQEQKQKKEKCCD
ncbi:hypothetical protein pb186bvf_008933 [Paramecium bursaria]